jgi:hypothetical protein
MGLVGRRIEFPDEFPKELTTDCGWITEELPISQKCLDELRTIQQSLSKQLKGPFEIFGFGLDIRLGSDKSVEKQLQRLTRASIWHVIAARVEFKLRLLYTIGGYLSAVETKNPIGSFLLARHLLELAATVNALDHELQNCALDPQGAP